MTLTDSPASAPDRRSRTHRGPRLFERSAILDEFEAIFSRSLAVPSSCIAIEGSRGSGRTALLNAAADVATRVDCLVLRAKGGVVEQQKPFAVLGRLIESAEAMAAAAGNDEGVERARSLESLLAEQAGPDDDPIRPRREPDDHQTASLFHRLVLTLRQTAPVLLAIDDADLGDPETLAVLQFLIRRLEHQQIWLVVTARPLLAGVGLRPVDGLLTEHDVRQFILEPLHDASVEAVLAGFFGVRPDPEFVHTCTEATGGSPFLLKALLPSLLRASVAPTAAMASSVEQIRASKITQSVLGRLAQLPAAATDLLRAAAVLGAEADPTLTRQLAAIDALAAEQAADDAEQIELIESGRPFRFTSPLFRWAVYQDIPTARRSQLHGAAAQLLDARGADDTVIANHLLATEPGGDIEVADRLQAIGRRAQAAGETALALRCLERALSECPLAERRSALYVDLAAAEVADQGSLALVHLRRALEFEGFDAARVMRVGVDLLGHLGEDDRESRSETITTLIGLRAQLDGVDRNLRIELELSLILTVEPIDQRMECLQRLRLLLDEPGDEESPITQRGRSVVAVNDLLSSNELCADELAEALEQIVDVGQLVGVEPLDAGIQTYALFGLLCTDRFAWVDNLLATASTHGSIIDREVVEQRITALSAISLLWQGALTEADDRCTRSEEAAGDEGSVPGRSAIVGHLDVLVEQGRFDEAERLARATEHQRIHLSIFRSLSQIERGSLLLAQGHADRALEEFTAAGRAGARAGTTNPAMVPWRAGAVVALVQLGEHEEARRLADENLGLARRFGAPRTISSALRASAAASSELGRRVELLTEAVSLLEPSGARLERARALVDLGTALIDSNRKEEARSVLRQGASLASLCGAHQLLELAGEQLRAAGARPRRLGLVGPESLTPSELRVVRMAADGLTNQRIADELYVTLKTVEGHLAKAYRKLGVDGRPDLAEALAGARGRRRFRRAVPGVGGLTQPGQRLHHGTGGSAGQHGYFGCPVLR